MKERVSMQDHIPHAPTLLQNAVFNKWQFQALVTGNQTENQFHLSSKGALLPEKKIKSEFPVDVHIKSFKTTKFHEILLSGFRGVALTNCFSSIFHFGPISKFKKGVIPRKNGIKISCGYAHLHIMSFITTQFHQILFSGFRWVALTRKTGLTDWVTDWLTNRRVKNIIPSATRCVWYYD